MAINEQQLLLIVYQNDIPSNETKKFKPLLTEEQIPVCFVYSDFPIDNEININLLSGTIRTYVEEKSGLIYINTRLSSLVKDLIKKASQTEKINYGIVDYQTNDGALFLRDIVRKSFSINGLTIRKIDEVIFEGNPGFKNTNNKTNHVNKTDKDGVSTTSKFSTKGLILMPNSIHDEKLSIMERLYPYYFYICYKGKKVIKTRETPGEDYSETIIKDTDYLLQVRNDNLFDNNKFIVFEQCNLSAFSQIATEPITISLSKYSNGVSLSFIDKEQRGNLLYTKYPKGSGFLSWIARMNSNNIFEGDEPNYFPGSEITGIPEIFINHQKSGDFDVLDYLFYYKTGEIKTHNNLELSWQNKSAVNYFIEMILADFSQVLEFPFSINKKPVFIVLGFERGSIIIKNETNIPTSPYKYRLYAFNGNYSLHWDNIFDEYIRIVDDIHGMKKPNK